MNAQLAASCLGLGLTAADWCACWNDEKRFVWRFPFKITAANFLYILINYLSFVIHTTDVVIAALCRTKFYPDPIPYDFCLGYYLFKAMAVCVVCTLLHSILMLRVYALYAKNRYMAAVLMLVFIGRTVVSGWTFFQSKDLLENRIPFNGLCVPAIYFQLRLTSYAIMEVALHAVWCGLTLVRTWSLRDAWPTYSTQNFGVVLHRDALLVYGGVLGVFLSILVGLFKDRLTEIVAVCVFPVLVAVMCRSGCRVVIHLQRLSGPGIDESSGKETGDLVLTTVDSTWDTHTRPL
ncbi:hypothetical protein PM082_022444 [Marasmius tenuissimus]|nr:hypothetical protein PM082_022444 [Marasmius tenuissimus]